MLFLVHVVYYHIQLGLGRIDIRFFLPFWELFSFLIEDTKNGIEVKVHDKINEANIRYDYIKKSAERLNNLFAVYGFEFWDYSNPSTIKSNNDEFIDGFHAGELTHAKILLNMSDNSSAINKYINYDSLINDIKNSKKNKLIIYD